MEAILAEIDLVLKMSSDHSLLEDAIPIWSSGHKILLSVLVVVSNVILLVEYYMMDNSFVSLELVAKLVIGIGRQNLLRDNLRMATYSWLLLRATLNLKVML